MSAIAARRNLNMTNVIITAVPIITNWGNAIMTKSAIISNIRAVMIVMNLFIL
jgi:hypothetical protein